AWPTASAEFVSWTSCRGGNTWRRRPSLTRRWSSAASPMAPPERRLPARQLDVRRCFLDGAVRHRPGAVLVEIPLKSRLRALRAERAWSQGDLATRLGVSRQTVNAIETEKYEPSLSLAFRIARLFRMHIDDVF